MYHGENVSFNKSFSFAFLLTVLVIPACNPLSYDMLWQNILEPFGSVQEKEKNNQKKTH